MILHPIHASSVGRLPCGISKDSGGVMTPIICMPPDDGDGRAMVERLAPLAEANLSFPALLVCPDNSSRDEPAAWAAILQAAQQRYPLTRRGLVFGIGRGASMAHAFALQHPAVVAGCVALAAELWLDPNQPGLVSDVPAVRDVPWMIGCGTRDREERIDAAEQFQVSLAELGCRVDFLDWDGDAANLPTHALENAMQFFNENRDHQRVAA